jgi:hypothetical protein
MLKPYKIINDAWIELLEGPYEGIVYKYGRVQLIEEGDTLRIKFDYEVVGGQQMDSNFVQYIGPILTDLIDEGVMNNSITYTGGVNED